MELPIRKSSQNVHAHFCKTQFCSKQRWHCLLVLHAKLFWKKLIALCFEYVNWWGSLMKVPKLITLLILVFSINDIIYRCLCNAALFFTMFSSSAIWFQWSLKRHLDVNCSKNAEPPCDKIDMQGHFRAFKPSWSKALGRWVFAGAIRDYVVRKVFNYNPTLRVLRGCRHQSCVCSFSVEFSGSSLHSHPWKPLGPWFSSGWARQTDLRVKKAEPLLVKTCFWDFLPPQKELPY